VSRSRPFLTTFTRSYVDAQRMKESRFKSIYSVVWSRRHVGRASTTYWPAPASAAADTFHSTSQAKRFVRTGTPVDRRGRIGDRTGSRGR
jgi:hypothetical protein